MSALSIAVWACCSLHSEKSTISVYLKTCHHPYQGSRVTFQENIAGSLFQDRGVGRDASEVAAEAKSNLGRIAEARERGFRDRQHKGILAAAEGLPRYVCRQGIDGSSKHQRAVKKSPERTERHVHRKHDTSARYHKVERIHAWIDAAAQKRRSGKRIAGPQDRLRLSSENGAPP